MKKSYRGWGFYISLIVVVVLVWFLLDGQHLNQDDYNYAQFEQELADDEIKSVEVQPNRVYPTGRLDIVKTDKSEETLYVLDVSEAQSLMDKEKFTSYVVNDIPAENWLMNLLPLLLVFGAMFILFMIVMNNQAAGGGGGSKMMNFGKSRAKMTTDENRNVTFENVAGLREEKEELEEIGVIEGEIQRLLPDEHIYQNLNQIVCIHEIKHGETQAGFREEMEKLYQTVQKQIFHRNKTTDFQIGIGSIVNGYGDLKKSFKDSKKIIDYMDMLRYLYGDKNISVADFSKLGFFQIFEKIENRDELMEYVPESLVKLYWYDKEHDGELIETLQAYLDCDKSANKAAEKLYVNYRTLSGRLKIIRDISGIDFKNSAEMLAVRNGIVLFKMAETL